MGKSRKNVDASTSGNQGGETERLTAERTVKESERSVENVEIGRVVARDVVNAGTDENAENGQQNVSETQVGLNVVLRMLAQVLERLPAVMPPAGAAVVPPGGEPVIPPTGAAVVQNERENGRVERHAERGNRRAHVPSYLEVLDHMTKLGTKYFSGGSQPIEADEWKTRLERNFESIRCPEEYKRDIAVHYLDGDAHIWWKGASGRLTNANCSWETFRALFKTKFFPPEAYDRLEGAFLDLKQGDRSVRDYEMEFNQLKRYAGRELEDEQVQVRRFMRGLRVELRNGCLVRNYATVAELVEKAALLEVGFAEESKLKGGSSQSTTRQGQNSGGNQNKKGGMKSGPQNKTSTAGRTACATCGKMHLGECRFATGACHRCGSLTHKVRDCPEEDVRTKNMAKEGERVCFYCKEPGHFKRECPKLGNAGQVIGTLKRPNDGVQSMAKRQAVEPRLYHVSASGEPSEQGTSYPITGKVLSPTKQ